MESLGILRSLWRHPIALAVGVVLALAVGAMAHYEVTLSPPSLKSRALESGYAQEHVLVDSQTSLIVDAQAKDAESISTRAIILSDLLADDAAKERRPVRRVSRRMKSPSSASARRSRTSALRWRNEPPKSSNPWGATGSTSAKARACRSSRSW